MKYGLVWDTEKNLEDIVLKCEKQLPYVEEVEELSMKGKGTSHVLIEGDNFASLSVMQQTHKNSVDIICIDPPYNTGNEFIYNDKRVDSEDNYRHSKWLNFMHKRMQLSYTLLKRDGICYTFIGQDELANLTLMMDQIFGRKNRISIISRITRKHGNSGNNIVDCCDYILAYAKDISQIESIGEERKESKEDVQYFINAIKPSKNQVYDIEFPCGTVISPPEGRGWKLAYDSFLPEFKAGNIFHKNGHVFRKKILTSDLKVRNFFFDNEFANRKGTQEVKALFGGVLPFDFPKPTALIKHLIKITNKPNDITVMDFFAGSGTTGHAVIDLNAEDQGTRSSIMCALNDFDDEADICTDVTYKRLKIVIDGWREKYNNQLDLLGDGFPPTLKYFKIKHAQNNDLTTKLLVDERNKETLTW